MYLPFQIGLLTGICLGVILAASFGPLATFFTKDPEVLHVVGMGVLVCLICLIYWFKFCLHHRVFLKLIFYFPLLLLSVC